MAIVKVFKLRTGTLIIGEQEAKKLIPQSKAYQVIKLPKEKNTTFVDKPEQLYIVPDVKIHRIKFLPDSHCVIEYKSVSM